MSFPIFVLHFAGAQNLARSLAAPIPTVCWGAVFRRLLESAASAFLKESFFLLVKTAAAIQMAISSTAWSLQRLVSMHINSRTAYPWPALVRPALPLLVTKTANVSDGPNPFPTLHRDGQIWT